MKIKSLYLWLPLCLVLFWSCNNDSISEPLGFNVELDTLHFYKVGDTLQFKISGGSADQIVFFSGELGNQYSNTNRLAEAGKPKLVFQTANSQGDVTDRTSLRLLISTNLKAYDSTGVVSATWTDITSRNTKWPTVLGTTFISSDSIDLSDFNTVSDSINIAFRFRGNNVAAAQPYWKISNLTLTNFLSDGNKFPLLSSFDNSGWVQVSLKNSLNTWNVGTWNVSSKTSLLNSSGITIRTAYPIEINPGTGLNVNENDDWLITRAVNLKTVNPDIGKCIKNSSDLPMSNYSYIYKNAGTYSVTFMALNVNNTTAKKVVKQIVVKIH
jgi:hypothetical protein